MVILLKILRLKAVLLLMANICLEKCSTGKQFLLTPASSSQSYQDQFKCRSIMYRNRLPLAVRTASSVTDFKAMLDEHKKNSIETGILNGYWELSEEVFKRI